jgi:hypothetical protein
MAKKLAVSNLAFQAFEGLKNCQNGTFETVHEI